MNVSHIDLVIMVPIAERDIVRMVPILVHWYQHEYILDQSGHNGTHIGLF